MERLDEEVKKEKKKVLCRVCLNYDCEKFAQGLSVFEKHNDVYVYEKINYIASIEIEKDDNLPDRVCSLCLLALESACNFKQLCENSDAFLHSTSLAEPQQKLETENPIKVEVEEEFDYENHRENSPTILEFNQENSLEPFEYQQDDDNTHNEETGVLELPKPDFVSRAIDLKLECHDCGGSFKSKCKLKVHWKKVHLPETLKCSNCKQKFKTYKALHNHMKRKSLNCVNASKVRVEGEGKCRIYHCKECDASSKRIHTIIAHLVRHTGERPFSCDLCNRSFTQLSGVRTHKENVHKKYNHEATCPVCGKLLQGRSKWSRHMRIHRNVRVTCLVCKKTYASKIILVNHMKRHSGVKSYACEICAKTFYCETDLYNHKEKKHFKNNIYTCEKCEYKSHNHSSITKHRRRHTPNNVPCEICGTFVENEQQLVLHKKRHFEKNSLCPYCDKGYFNRKHLLAHIRKKHNLYGHSNIDDKTKIIKNLKHTT